MSSVPDLQTMCDRVRAFIQRHAAGTPGDEFDKLALEFFRFQYHSNPPYRSYCDALGRRPATVDHLQEIPAMVTSVFKDFELTVLPREERTVVFHSSGTTQQRPGRHYHSSDTLAVYEESLKPWFRRFVLADLPRPPFLVLSPDRIDAPHSSLVYMFDALHRAFGSRGDFLADPTPEGWRLRVSEIAAVLQSQKKPVVLCGTAFSFVHLCDELEEQGVSITLPAGSRIFETGGYKGRSRSVTRPDLYEMLRKRLGVPVTHIISEYGMSELSSQAYDRVAGSDQTRCFLFPPWARAFVLSPETGREVAEGETGLLRVYDLANVGSVMAVQTEDLAVRLGNGFELRGRAVEAEARGCSLMQVGS